MALARLTGSPDLKIPEPTKTPSAPNCIINAASAGLQRLQPQSLQLAIFHVHGRIEPILQVPASP